jgi:DNA polymerase III delta prime subunit
MFGKHCNNNNIPWVEKYRPPSFNDIVLDPINRTLFNKMIETNYIPNLLFYGPPGTGKTTTIINLISEYNNKYYPKSTGNIIHLNASDDRGIDVIRTQIYQFVRSKNLIDPGLKIVVLDEVDYMTKTAQYALKCLLQTSGFNVRYCLICNYISKIDESLKNEFICIRFNQLPKQDIHKYIKNIAENENITITSENINNVQQLYNSDMRSMINFIQLNKHNLDITGKKILSPIIWENIHNLLLKYIKLNDETLYNEIIEYLYNVSNQYNEDMNTIIKKYFNYVIRTYKKLLTKDFFDFLEIIMHMSGNNIHNTIDYIIHNIHIIYIEVI